MKQPIARDPANIIMHKEERGALQSLRSSMKKIDIIYFVIVIACFIGVGIALKLLITESGQCLKNPFVYGASEMENVTCSCIQERNNCPAMFTFNDTMINFSSNTICGNINK